MNKYKQDGWITIDRVAGRAHLVKYRDSWKLLLFLVPLSADISPKKLCAWIIKLSRNVPSPLSPCAHRLCSGRQALLALLWHGTLSSLCFPCSGTVVSQPPGFQCFSWRDGHHAFCVDSKSCKAQTLIVKSLKPLAELAWLYPWRQKLQLLAWGCFKGVSLCFCIYIASHVTWLMSMRMVYVFIIWRLWEVRVPDGRTGFYSRWSRGHCCVLSLAICCPSHGLIVTIAGCTLWNTGSMCQYLGIDRLVHYYEKLTSLPKAWPSLRAEGEKLAKPD